MIPRLTAIFHAVYSKMINFYFKFYLRQPFFAWVNLTLTMFLYSGAWQANFSAVLVFQFRGLYPQFNVAVGRLNADPGDRFILIESELT